MLSAAYEVHLVCDECGRLVSRRSVDAATFERLVEESNPILPVLGPDEREVVDEGDLLSEEGERPVEVLIQHVSGCGYCTERP